jgi:EmrB/QacA subfamily drug resistance transporter
MAGTGDALQAPSHREVMVAFSGLLLALLLAALDGTIVATALPTIVGELGGLSHLSWVVTAYLLAQTVVTPLYGKFGDLYGRKRVLQVAIVVFLAGSALCGAARSLAQLILFRAVQGLGGGGLMVTAQAVVGDLVPPRDRGRYQGMLGAAFGVASIAGPLLGGYLTTHWSWRWIFYINLPLGVVALGVLRATLPAPAGRVRRAVDYAGAATLALALTGIVLATDLGGAVYPWASPVMLAVVAGTLACGAAFVVAERRASEPVLPLDLFRNRAFTVSCVVGFIVGFGLFGSVTYVPLFLQVVQGQSPTASGMEMIPMMGGMLLTSIASGQVISRTGRYKVFPVIGTAVLTLGLFLLSRMHPDTGLALVMASLAVVGLGLGMVMQVLVIAVQNAVDYDRLGVATSGAILFRLVGGSIGTSVLGAIFAARLAGHLSAAGSLGALSAGTLTPHALAALPEAVRAAYAQAFAASLGSVFAVATVVGAIGFALVWLLPERPLRRTLAAATAEDMGGDVGEAFAMSTADDPLPRLLRGLTVLADRDLRRRYVEDVIARAGVDVDPPSAVLLVKLHEERGRDPLDIGRTYGMAPETVQRALGTLAERGWIEKGAAGGWTHTAAGCEVLRRLVDARRARIAEMFSDWPADQRARMAQILRRLSQELVPDAPGEPARP